LYISAWILVHAINPVSTMGQQRHENVPAVMSDSGHRRPPAVLKIENYYRLPDTRDEWSVT
jgi:hypothetical protein